MSVLRKMLFVGPYPPPYAGPETAMKTLLESSQLTDRFDIKLLKTNVRTSNDEKGRFDLTLVKAFFVFVFSLINILIRFRPEVVYQFVTATKMGWLGRDIWGIFIARMLGAKVIIHMRAGHFKHNYLSMHLVEKLPIKAACRLVSLGIVQADSLKDQLKGLIDDNQIRSVYNVIDTTKFSNQDLHDYDKFVFLFLGHLSSAKGYCDLLKAIPLVAEKYPDVCFWFGGTRISEERNVFQNQLTGEALISEDPQYCYDKYIAGQNEKNYRHFGMVNEAKKIKLLKQCNALILPSYSEGFSMSVLEAMTIGKPVICSPVGALGEVVKDGVNGYIVEPGDIGALAKAIEKVLKNEEERNRMAIHNYKETREKFSQKIIGGQLAELFQELI